MQPIITDNLKAIQDACKIYGVKELYVFGSAVRDDFSEQSDVDFMAEFSIQKNIHDAESVEYFYDNRERFREFLTNILTREVDLLVAGSITNKYLRYFINQEKKLIYGEA